jgi:hypothetical protein
MSALLGATPADAIGDTDAGNSQITIETPAYVEGELWADSHGAYLVATRQNRCWYPQDWYDDVVVIDDLGEITGYNEDSIYYNLVFNELGADPEWFAPLDPYTSRSCVQGVFLTRDDCSTDERIAVLATSATRDARTGALLNQGDFDLHDVGGLYCLVVIVRDPWLELVRDESLVPQPIRATYPQYRTLVGLDNQVWYEVAADQNPTNEGFAVSIPTMGNDYNLTLQIWLAGIRVDIDGDGVWEYANDCAGASQQDLAACAGSLENPVYTFEYETRAFHPFTIRTHWAGIAVDETGQVLNIDPGMLLNEYTFDWETVEVRSSLDG